MTFGDSLTHNRLLGFPFRTALFGDDPMEAVFDKGATSGDRLTSYAIAGSTSEVVRAQILAYALRYLAGRSAAATSSTRGACSAPTRLAWTRPPTR